MGSSAHRGEDFIAVISALEHSALRPSVLARWVVQGVYTVLSCGYIVKKWKGKIERRVEWRVKCKTEEEETQGDEGDLEREGAD